MGHHDERALLERVARRDQRAFEALYELYGRSVYSLAAAMLHDPRAAEEVAQEVFLALWRGAADFDPKRGEPRSWILSLAHHKAVDAVRRRRLRATEPLSDAMPDDSDVAGRAMESVEQTRVRDALATLPPPQRQAIALAYYRGFTQQEIAQRLGLPLGTVKTRIRDGMLRMRGLLGGPASEIGL
jgi:RNA polymerase sigma-70 factor (ECF subfamily)